MTVQDVVQVEVEEERGFIVGKNNRFGIEAGTITPGVPEVVTSEDEGPCGKRVDTSKVITADSKDFLKRKLDSLKERLLAAPRPEGVGEGGQLSTDGPAFPEAKRTRPGPTYTVHMVNTSTKRKLDTERKVLLDGNPQTKIIGALAADDGVMEIEGCDKKYQKLLEIIKKQLRTASPPLGNYAFTNALISSDLEFAAEHIAGEESEGAKTIWGWAENGCLKVKFNESRWMNLHGKLLSWDGLAELKFKASDESNVFLVHTFVRKDLGSLGEDEAQSLTKMGFCPKGIHRGNESDSETTVPEEEQDLDPTRGLEPIEMSEAWKDSGPPAKGSGWLGIGPPVMVNHNYKVRPMEDGAGICSPGRWRPGYRNLPDTASFGEDMAKAAGIDM